MVYNIYVIENINSFCYVLFITLRLRAETFPRLINFCFTMKQLHFEEAFFMNRKAYTDKILVIGVDGLDPRLSKKYIGEGRMPNFEKLIARGSCREDLSLFRRSAHRHAAYVDDIGHRHLSRHSRHHLLQSQRRRYRRDCLQS